MSPICHCSAPEGTDAAAWKGKAVPGAWRCYPEGSLCTQGPSQSLWQVEVLPTVPFL